MKDSLESVYIKTDEFSGWIKDKYFKDKDLITLYDLIGEFEEAVDKCEHLEEELEDLKVDIEENYRPLTQAELIDWNENW